MVTRTAVFLQQSCSAEFMDGQMTLCNLSLLAKKVLGKSACHEYVSCLVPLLQGGTQLPVAWSYTFGPIMLSISNAENIYELSGCFSCYVLNISHKEKTVLHRAVCSPL